MNPPSNDSDSFRFQGGVRHYHRHGTQSSSSWDEWVDGKPRGKQSGRKVAKVIGVILAIGGLLAVVVGLVVELG